MKRDSWLHGIAWLSVSIGIIATTFGEGEAATAFYAYGAAMGVLAWKPKPIGPVEAGRCTSCSGLVYHRDGKPGEFDHECSAQLSATERP